MSINWDTVLYLMYGWAKGQTFIHTSILKKRPWESSTFPLLFVFVFIFILCLFFSSSHLPVVWKLPGAHPKCKKYKSWLWKPRTAQLPLNLCRGFPALELTSNMFCRSTKHLTSHRTKRHLPHMYMWNMNPSGHLAETFKLFPGQSQKQ